MLKSHTFLLKMPSSPPPQTPLFPLCCPLKRTLCYHIPNSPGLPFWVYPSLSRSSLCPEGLLHGSYTYLLGWTSSDSVCREMLYLGLILQGCFVSLCLWVCFNILKTFSCCLLARIASDEQSSGFLTVCLCLGGTCFSLPASGVVSLFGVSLPVCP